jgi:catechol 2,3-dioxygenase-like lactoylglutathione lyase family enzyme
MAIVLNHMIVPAKDKDKAAKFFANIFGLETEPDAYFVKVKLNDTLTLLFDQHDRFDVHHYAFHVSDAEFDDIFNRVKKAGLKYGSNPGNPEDGKINRWGGGRGVYFADLDGHLLELMTVPQ